MTYLPEIVANDRLASASVTQHRPLPTQSPSTWSPRQALIAAPRDHRIPEFGCVAPRTSGRPAICDRLAVPTATDRQLVADALYRPLGLRGNPFPQTVSINEVIPAIAHAARELANWASSEQSGGQLAIVTGAAGSGRTSLLQAMTAMLAAGGGAPIRVVDVALGETRLPAGRLLRAIVTAIGETPRDQTSLTMTRQIRDAANAIHPMLLLLDGARALDGSHLDVLRALLLGKTSLRIIVTGPSSLVDRIRRRQSLAEHLSSHHQIAPLDGETLATYLRQRIDAVSIAGGHQPAHFAPGAIAIIAAWSEGSIGPAIDLAGECLLEAIARGRRTVEDDIAHDVTREFIDRARLAARRGIDTAGGAPTTQATLTLSETDSEAPRREPASTGGR